MSIYTYRKGFSGSKIYVRDGIATKADTVPEEVKTLLKKMDSVDSENIPTEAPLKKECIFCGEPMVRRKFINLQTVALCDEHYFNKTSGEIVEQVRSIDEKS